jgi:hypothetical protein
MEFNMRILVLVRGNQPLYIGSIGDSDKTTYQCVWFNVLLLWTYQHSKNMQHSLTSYDCVWFNVGVLPDILSLKIMQYSTVVKTN